jgi:hypothetical protein
MFVTSALSASQRRSVCRPVPGTERVILEVTSPNRPRNDERDEIDYKIMNAWDLQPSPQRTVPKDRLSRRIAGRMKLLAMVTDPKSVTRYLAKIGEPSDVPARSPNRGPPYWKSTVLRRQAGSDGQ